jgi:nucleotide-binding universal stress UspA family protein
MPFPYRKILCPISFDSNSDDVIANAVSLATDSGSMIYLLHVLQISPLTAQGAVEGPAGRELYDSQVEAARARLEELAATIPAGIGRELAVEIGEPANLIVAAQQQLGVDLVVMATHGRRGLKHLVLGSVAERVVRESTAPVLTLRGPKE